MIKSKIANLLLLSLASAGLVACSEGDKQASEQSAEQVVVQLADKMIDAAVNSPLRAEQAKRDQYRHPAETLKFFGLKPNMTVVEILPGGGWYTSVINPVVNAEGQLYAAHFHPFEGAPSYYLNSLNAFKEKVETNPLYKNIKITEFHQTKAHDIAPEGTADMVLTFRNVHNWYMGDGDEGVVQAFKAFNKALKPGGILGVVEHRMPEQFDQEENKRSGYMKQSYVVSMAEKAGFTLLESSEVNANPKDTADHPKGVWTLPPRLALGDEEKAKYQSIGESDRMTLKFIKK